MSRVIRIESFPEENRLWIAAVITRYTGMYAVDELLATLPVEFEVEDECFEAIKSQLDQLGCNQKFVSIDELAQEFLPAEDRAILPLARADLIKRSLRLYWQNFRLFLGLSSILWVPIMVGHSLPYYKDPTYTLAYVLLTSITVYLLSQLAYEHILLASSERLLGREARFMDTWRRVGVVEFLEFAWANILAGLVVTAGYLLLVIPGIIWSIRLAINGPVTAIEGKTGPTAIRRSFQLAKGHGGRIFGTLFGVGLLIGLAKVLIAVVVAFLGQLWGAQQQAAAWYADLIAYTITTPLMAITLTTLYYYLRALSLKDIVLKEAGLRPTSP